MTPPQSNGIIGSIFTGMFLTISVAEMDMTLKVISFFIGFAVGITTLVLNIKKIKQLKNGTDTKTP